MSCIEKHELEQFLAGKLEPERLLAVDEHVSGCERCRSVLMSLLARSAFAAGFGASLLGVEDCPDHEELSAFADNALDRERAAAVRAHANACEICARDITTIQELRSHALLTDKVTVRPGARRAAPSSLIPWKRAVAAVGVAAAIVAVALSIRPFGTEPARPSHVAVRPPKAPAVSPAPVEPTEPPVVVREPEPQPNAPTVRTVLRDGSYRVIERGGKLILAKSDGTKLALAPKLSAYVDEKLATGKVKPAEPVRIAMASVTTLRDAPDGYVPPPTAPKLIGPNEKMLLTDRPRFKWTPVEFAASYRLTVFAEDGAPVATEITDGSSLTLTKPLVRGRTYLWRAGVKFAESDSWTESAAGKFHVISASDYAAVQRVKRQLPGSHLALGVAYERVGLTDEAAAEYRALRRQNRDSGLARKLLYATIPSDR